MTQQLSLFTNDELQKVHIIEPDKPKKKGSTFRHKKTRKLQQGESRIDRLYKTLAVDIFGTDQDLEDEQDIFVWKKVKEYAEEQATGYRERIKSKVMPILGRYLKDRENELILSWFMQRIPPFVIIRAIEACHEIARQGGRQITSMFYFDKRVIHEFTHGTGIDRPSIESYVYSFDLQKGSKWHYEEWKMIHIDKKGAGYSWDPFYGAVL